GKVPRDSLQGFRASRFGGTCATMTLCEAPPAHGQCDLPDERLFGLFSKHNLMTDQPKNKPRILSGMRPTGKLHLGNLVGALQNWVKLQEEYDSFHFVADWHMLTTDYADTTALKANTWDMVADWLAVGLDPNKAK